MTAAVAVEPKKKNKRKSKGKGRHLRTYEMGHRANIGKEVKVRAVLREYQPLLVKVGAWQYRRLLSGQNIWNTANPSHIPSALSERYKRSANNQACETLSSWVALVEDEIRRIIVSAIKDPARRGPMLYVNASHKWFAHEPDGTFLVPSRVKSVETGAWEKVEGVWDVVSAEDMKLLRRIFKHVKRNRVHYPRLGKTRTMKLDGPVAQWEMPKGGAESFDYWLRFSTLEKGKPVCIPLRSTRYAEARPGEWTNTAQITLPVEGPMVVRLVKELTKPASNKDRPECEVGLDFGLRSLFATSEGDLMGRNFYRWLIKIDAQLTALAKALQQQGIKLNDSKRYRAFQRRIREHAKNEINRIINRIIDLYGPTVLMVEELDFRGGGLSKRLNRTITRVGRGVVKTKLRNIAQDHDITVVPVPAPYSSQECNGCHFVDDRNRKNTVFSCRFCGRKGQADIEAGRTVKSRRSWPSASLYWPRPQVLAVIDEAFEQRWGINPAIVRAKNRRQKPATSSIRLTADGLSSTSYSDNGGATALKTYVHDTSKS